MSFTAFLFFRKKLKYSYISLDNAIISGFEELTGVKVLDSCDCRKYTFYC